MKSILAWILSLTFLFAATDSIADKWWYFAGDNEPLYGTWINMEYYSSPPQKVIYNPDGTGGSSVSIDLDPSYEIKYLITGKWTDPEGNIMYKIHWIGSWREEAFSLIRISNSGNTLEYVFDHEKHPDKIDPSHEFYRKYTRK